MRLLNQWSACLGKHQESQAWWCEPVMQLCEVETHLILFWIITLFKSCCFDFQFQEIQFEGLHDLHHYNTSISHCLLGFYHRSDSWAVCSLQQIILRRLHILSVVTLSSCRWHSSLAELVLSAALGCAAERRKAKKGFKVGEWLLRGNQFIIDMYI